MENERIRQFIKELREKNGLTQVELAERLGVTFQAVSKWENGKNIPNMQILKKISKEFGIDIYEIITGEKKEGKLTKKAKILLLSILLVTLALVAFLLIHFSNHDNYEFKTLSSGCENFNVSGIAAFNKDKSSIYIPNVTYCGGDDNTEYKEIKCALYESYGDTEKKIMECGSSEGKNKTLADYLHEVNLNIDSYQATCSNFHNAEIYMQINATEGDGKVRTFKVPLKLEDSCTQ